MDATLPSDFPVWGLLPKRETGVDSFLNKHPEYDGTGITIAIFDSGVDPGAPGLQSTPDGSVKVIERYDCSGCGDVCTTTIVQPKEGYITGITGRKLKIPASWVNPSNNFRIGVKHAFDLYPERLQERIQEEYKQEHWECQYKTVLADVNRELTKIESKTNSATSTEEEKLEKEDIEAKIEFLTNADKKYNDFGPVYDCVLFHDGTKWLACVDTSENGDLDNCVLLGEYSITHEYAPLTKADQLNFSINVHDDGNVLEIVGLCSSHGTHVASIASAYFPKDSDKNGVAPGAKIVSLTIGDGRLGSMETGTALVRAMIKVMELQKTQPLHVINMSYGEHAHWSNAGRIGELINEVINKYGVVWVASAGNHGPALSTVSTPPDICQDNIIGVGAYVSPDMMVAEYSMIQKLPGIPYTWSSRGPTLDGGFGVCICAPGGAITSVPNFTLRNSQLMNGTSMASPHVAGAVALLLSALKQNSISYSPYFIKRALENTAFQLEGIEAFAQGRGLLQVENAYEYLTTYQNAQERDIRFNINCGTSNCKGIYLRTKKRVLNQEFSISVEPFFLNHDQVNPSKKINFNIKVILSCKGQFVRCPSHLDLSNLARVFAIKIDSSGLPEGVHHTVINGYDSSCVNKGPIFRIPITVVVPSEVMGPSYSFNYNNVHFFANTIQRHFYVVPDLATWALLQIKSPKPQSFGRFFLHCMQLLPKQSCKSLEVNKNLTVTDSNTLISLQVKGGLILELVLAKYWADYGEIYVDYTISFHGIKPNIPHITMQSVDGIQSLEVTSMNGEDISPAISLKTAVQVLRPNESKVYPLKKRDIIPPGRQIYELLLNYGFHLNKSTEVSPNCPLLSDVLYESEFESQLWMIYDSNKQFMGCGDAYPSKYLIKLEKGDYVLKMHIRHDKKEYLEKMVDTPMLLNQKLSNPINLDVYSSYSHALVGGKKAMFGHSLCSTTVPLYIAILAADKYSSKNNNPAQYLSGYITFAKEEWGKKVDSYNFKYILHESNSKRCNKSVERDKSKWEEYKDALRDLKTLWLSKMDVPANANTLFAEMKTEFSDHFPIYPAYFQSKDPMDIKRQAPLLDKIDVMIQNKEEIEKIIAACDSVINNTTQQSLLAFYAVKSDPRPDAAQIKINMDRQKSALIDCLCRKGIALCRLFLLSKHVNEEKSITLEEIGAVWLDLLKFVDVNDAKIYANNALYFAAWHANVHGHYGRMLKYLQKLQEDKSQKEIEEKIIEVCNLLGWDFIVKHLQRSLPSKFPASYRPF